MIILIFILVIEGLFIFWLTGYVIKLHKLIDMQIENTKKLGDYICKNKEEICRIKNNIYQ
ncbi:MAG: hypothetical protein J6B89_03655 [Bacilli bacterium]|nr:hypothetical protein [Bacilli bacterium]